MALRPVDGVPVEVLTQKYLWPSSEPGNRFPQTACRPAPWKAMLTSGPPNSASSQTTPTYSRLLATNATDCFHMHDEDDQFCLLMQRSDVMSSIVYRQIMNGIKKVEAVGLRGPVGRCWLRLKTDEEPGLPAAARLGPAEPPLGTYNNFD